MIATKLMGGLGNQMFQYSVGRMLSLKNHTNLILDISHFTNQPKNETPREFELDCFNIRAKLSSLPLDTNAYERRFRKPLILNVLREKSLAFDPQVLHSSDNTILIGHWASEKYFRDIRTILLNDFSIRSKPTGNNKDILKRIQNTPSISLHVRRGDYVNDKTTHDFHGLKGIDYYQSAYEVILKKYKDDYTIFVFSDDIEWCKKNIQLNCKLVFVEGNSKGFEDMRLMMNCNHNIVANSTFSWWGAWLNESADSITVAPKKWLNEPGVSTADLIPDDWLQI